MTLFLKYWKKQHLHPLLHLHSHHLGAHGLRPFVHLYYNYAHVMSNFGKNKQYAMSHRQVAWPMFLPCFDILFGLSKEHGGPNGLWKLFMADNVICSSYNYLPVISVMLVDAKYLRVGNCLFLCVQGWGREHKIKNIVNSWRFASSRNWPMHKVLITLSRVPWTSENQSSFWQGILSFVHFNENSKVQ